MPTLLREYYFWFEILAFLVSLFVWGKLQFTRLSTLPFYLAFILLMEVITFYMKLNRQMSNTIINSLLIPVEFVYLLLLLRSFLNDRRLKKVVVMIVLAYLLILTIDLLYYRETYLRLYLRSYITGVCFLVIACCFYFFEMMNSERILSFYQNPEFWLTTGVLIFYLGTLPFHIYLNTGSSKNVEILVRIKGIFYLLMCTMYIFFTIAMIRLK